MTVVHHLCVSKWHYIVTLCRILSRKNALASDLLNMLSDGGSNTAEPKKSKLLTLKIGGITMYLACRNQDWLPSVFNDIFDTNFLPKMKTTAPAINVIEKSNEYDVELAAPGMTKDDFKVTLDEDENLVVDLEKKFEDKQENKENGHYLRREFSYTKFHQTLLLPDDVDREKIAATVDNGVLKVVLPKRAAEPKKESKIIEIK